MTATPAGWGSGTTYTYQWYYSDTKDMSKATPMVGATGKTVVLKAEHMGGWIGLVITGTTPGKQGSPKATAPMVGPVTPIVTRIGGSNRYETAGLINKRFSTKTGGVMFIASGVVFPDALSAAPVAAKLDASLILTSTNTLEPAARAAIKRQQPDEIILVGQTSTLTDVVKQQVIAEIGDASKVSRVGGTDRYATSRDLFTKYFADGSAKTVYIATGIVYPDALAAAPAASFENGAVLLVRGTSADKNLDLAIAAMKKLGTTNVKVVGGTSTIIAPSFTKMNATFASTSRLAGATRYATAVAVNRIFPKITEYVWIASGENFADAFVAAVPAGVSGAPIYLTQKSCVTTETATAIKSLKYAERIISGGPNSVSNAAMALTACQ